MEFKSLAGVSFETIFRAFNRAFAEYEIQLDDDQLRTMLRRRGFDPALSFAAFEADEIVAFTLNGVGNFNGTRTAYDTGTGTLTEYRGQGLATKVFEYSIPYLKEAGVVQYLLEVLQHNPSAISVYRNLGFETSREFNYFVQENKEVNFGQKDSPYLVERIELGALKDVSAFWDFIPSWQNSCEAIERATDDFVFLGVKDGGKLVGYAVFEPASGDITQLAVEKSYRRRGIATTLLKEMLGLDKNDTIKAVNTEISCESVNGFLQARNVALRGKQFEMIKRL